MAKTIVIASKLPFALTITHPTDKSKKTEIQGLNTSMIKGAPYNTTHVDAELWDLWKSVYSTYAPLKNGAIFEASSDSEAKVKAKDLENEKTGLEPLNATAHGVKPADKD